MNHSVAKKLLVIMAKAPEPGFVKTRLCPDFTQKEAAELYRCFLKDRLGEMHSIKDVDLAVAYAPQDAKAIFATLAPEQYNLFPQCNAELGEKLRSIFSEKTSQGYEAIVITDSDSPDLPRSIIQEAFDLLLSGGKDVVLGPCEDGGYYLIGMKKNHPELLEDIPWSTPEVLQATMKKAEKSGIKTALLAQWNDIDTYQDLVAFHNNNKNQIHGGNWPGAITFSCLTRLRSQFSD